jgi:glycosyltransferase involved in cell wall biosynthesis
MNIFISVIIPTLNRSNSLHETLSSIVKCSFDKSMYEIIIVDNGSTDDTFKISNSFILEHNSYNISYYYESMPGLLSGRHRGVSEAKGDIFSFIDDDVEVFSTWLSGIYSAFDIYDDADLVTGPCYGKYNISTPEWLSFLISPTPYGGTSCSWLSLIDLGNDVKYIDPLYVWGLNYSIRKSTFYKICGFNPDCMPKKFQCYQGDGESGLSIKASLFGFRALYHPDVSLNHVIENRRLTKKYFFKRAYYQGVCDSYSSLRLKYYSDKTREFNFVFFLFYNYIDFFSFLKALILFYLKIILKSNLSSDSNKIFFDKLKKYHIRGYYFHHFKFFTNLSVRKWVLKDNYLKYNIPNL